MGLKVKRRISGRSRILIQVVTIWMVSFVVGGGVYTIVDRPPYMVMHPYTGRPTTIHWEKGEQTLSETLTSTIFNACTISGLMISYNSAKITNNPTRANAQLVLGMALTTIGLGGNYYLLRLKRISQLLAERVIG